MCCKLAYCERKYPHCQIMVLHNMYLALRIFPHNMQTSPLAYWNAFMNSNYSVIDSTLFYCFLCLSLFKSSKWLHGACILTVYFLSRVWSELSKWVWAWQSIPVTFLQHCQVWEGYERVTKHRFGQIYWTPLICHTNTGVGYTTEVGLHFQ